MEQLTEIRRLHTVCREKNAAMKRLIDAVELFFACPLSIEGLTALRAALAEAKDFLE